MSTIAGRVLDADGNPVPGASVAVSSGPGPVNDIAVVTDVEGRFRLGNLGPGRFALTANGANDLQGTAAVEVAADEQAVAEIRLGEVQPDPTGDVTVVADRVDWSKVRLVRVSLRDAATDPGEGPVRDLFFSPSNTASATWGSAVHGPYTYTVYYYLAGGLQRTVGPQDGDARTLVLDPMQGPPGWR